MRTRGHPDIEAAVDAALRAAELEVVEIAWDELAAGADAFAPIYFDEMWAVDHALVAEHPDEVGADIAQTVAVADMFRPGADAARQSVVAWRERLAELFGRVEVLALPTLPVLPPPLDGINADTMLPTVIEITSHVALFNAAGTPVTAQPVPVTGGRLPASLQLVGPHNGEELLLATAQIVERSVQ